MRTCKCHAWMHSCFILFTFSFMCALHTAHTLCVCCVDMVSVYVLWNHSQAAGARTNVLVEICISRSAHVHRCSPFCWQRRRRSRRERRPHLFVSHIIFYFDMDSKLHKYMVQSHTGSLAVAYSFFFFVCSQCNCNCKLWRDPLCIFAVITRPPRWISGEKQCHAFYKWYLLI